MSEDYPPGLEWEYRSLRDEIVTRMRLRQQMMGVALTVAGAFMAVGLEVEAVSLVSPPLAAFLVYGWAQNDYRIGQIASHIRNRIESNSALGLSWESHMKTLYPEVGPGSWRFVVLSHGGIFAGTAVMAFGIGLSHSPFSGVEVFLIVLDLVAFIGLAYPIWRSWKRVDDRT